MQGLIPEPKYSQYTVKVSESIVKALLKYSQNTFKVQSKYSQSTVKIQQKKIKIKGEVKLKVCKLHLSCTVGTSLLVCKFCLLWFYSS